MTIAELMPQPGTRVRLTGHAAQAIETGRLRLTIAGVVFAVAFLGVALRLVDVMALGHASAGRAAGPGTLAEIHGGRADILDRNGVILATTLPSASVFADPMLVIDPIEAAEKLDTALPGLDYGSLLEALSSDRRFVWIKRGLTPEEHERVNRLGIPGIAFQTEQRRVWPLGALTAHVVGFTDVDGHGIAGMEKSLDGRLIGTGGPVRLSLDVRLQALLHEELSAAIAEFRAIGGCGLIMDARTGEILAMVSLPDFDPYTPAGVPEETLFNRNTLGVYEMGSTFKIFNTALALDSGAARLSDGFDATRPIRVGRYTISDFHPEGRWLTVPEIFMHSSNIGSVRMALAAGIPVQQDYLARFGLTRPAPVELPEVGDPMVPSPWREINTMTIAFGHGMAVSPVQLVAGVAAAVNGGTLPRATVLAADAATPPAGPRVISAETSDAMRRLLRLVVEEGTGAEADAEGYLVGGKTGTAEKARGRGYNQNARLSSFVAAFPMSSPEYVVFAMLDEPKGNARTFGYATGGWVAAPVIRRVVEQMGPMVGLAPALADAPEIRRSLEMELGEGESRLASFTDQ
jgi:cell division protein FtsI (penicillin-binding protein 3)